ncbi:phosphatidate cytidylyltransferase [Oscillatoria sp. FACHB-1407]|uniref:diacylglycerol/polyprenol kinase family protein n=1 Tax=Oscillatoria sp. FACHB-1407 TaxID=2692847 RepID=UPI00168894EE|nr:diacylglycerol/polyprenol kinase family protein [Oscillatoria sp. FACHB-1407]MBD2464070.1 phosphatidate cytidylyltransferase [Oscillatoria sp. FACHB-1407]
MLSLPLAFPWLESVPPLWLQLIVVAIWLVIVVLSAEVLHRLGIGDGELVRKVVHIGVGNIILLAWWLQIPAWLGVAASVMFSAIALLSYRVPILPSVNSVGRKSLGTFFYAVSFGILIAYFWNTQPHYAVLGILVMTWGDGLAALVGRRWGQHFYKLWDMQKSWEGSLTMGVASFIVSGLLLSSVQGGGWQTWMVAGVIAIAATGLEAFSKYGVDNLTVPVGSAALAFWLSTLA